MERVVLSYDIQQLAEKLKVVVDQNEQHLIPQIIQEFQKNGDKYAQVTEYAFVEEFEDLCRDPSLTQQQTDPLVAWVADLKLKMQSVYPFWEKNNNFGNGFNVKAIFYSYLKCVGIDVLAMESELKKMSHSLVNEAADSVLHNKIDAAKKLDQASVEETTSKQLKEIQETLYRIEEEVKKQTRTAEQRWHEIPTAIHLVTIAIRNLSTHLENSTKDHLIFSENKLKEILGGIKDTESKTKISKVKKDNEQLKQDLSAMITEMSKIKRENAGLTKEKELQNKELEKSKQEAAHLKRERDNLKQQYESFKQEQARLKEMQEKAKLMKPIPPPKFIVHYKMDDRFIMAEEIVRCFTEIQTKSNYEFRPFEQDDLKSCQLLINFELVDDRIREVETKQALSQSLLGMTKNNCVWAFICFKPTENQDGTKITNSVQNLTSGYTTKDGNFVQCYLTSEYVIDASKTDKAGNLLHVLSNKEKFKQQITALLEQKKPALLPVSPQPETRNLESNVKIFQPAPVMDRYLDATSSDVNHQRVSVSKGATTLQLSIADDQRLLATVHIQSMTGSSVRVQPGAGVTKRLPQFPNMRDMLSDMNNNNPLEKSDRATDGFVLLDKSVLTHSSEMVQANVQPATSECKMVSVSLKDIPDTLLELGRVISREHPEFAGKRIQIEVQDYQSCIKLESDSQVKALQSGYLPNVQFCVRIQ